MKTYKKTMIITTSITLLPMLLGILLWKRLPESLPTHWGADNQIDGWSSRAFAVFGTPLMLAGIHLVCLLMTLNDPKKKNISSRLLKLVFWMIPVISCVCCSVTFLVGMGKRLNVGLLVNILIGVIFLVIGNYMPKSRQSYTVGVRLPWTLNSTENWNRTNRLAGKLFVLAGLAFLANALLQFEELTIIVLIMVMVIPSGYSFLLYKKGI